VTATIHLGFFNSMGNIKAVFFDAANTLLHKPALYPAMTKVLASHGVVVPCESLLASHRALSEVITFPDRTSTKFYSEFNRSLLLALGVLPSNNLLTELFTACSYLPWEPFADTQKLISITLPLGVISNWDSSLQDKLNLIKDVQFSWVLGSEEQCVRKPDSSFFKRALDATGFEANEIIYVGDSMRLDIEPALQLGIRALLIDRDDLYPFANVKRIRSMSELGDML
jgi:FMN phosphatase YigB (HAD superfamily)